MSGKSILFVFVLFILFSCSDNNEFIDHQLVGNYEETGESMNLQRKMSIEPFEDGSGLYLLLNSVEDSIPLITVSQTNFEIDRFEVNGFYIDQIGELNQDSLFMTTRSFLDATASIPRSERLSKFVRVE